MELHIEVPATATAPRRARHAVNDSLSALPGGTRELVHLALSEMVANAVRHGGLGPRDSVHVIVQTSDSLVRVCVEQHTPAPATRRSHDEGPRENGMGLAIVEEITDRWGFEQGPPGRVWFEVGARRR